MSQPNGKRGHSTCPECEVVQMARNHYFTGKLMVDRDFTDEQRFFLGKEQRHNQRLHGWGVVCGLKVVQHPNEICRDKYVIIEPGTAIDCCGHEIIVPDELRGEAGRKGVHFNLGQHPKIKALRSANDRGTHTLQFCVRYKECPTEEIPVLYDECGCDETKCAPNRILESYQFDVLIDEQVEIDEPHSVRLEWKYPISLAHSTHLVLDDSNGRLFVVSSTGTGSSIHAIDTRNHSIVDSVTLPDKALAVALSHDGKQFYVAVATSPAVVRVLDAASLTNTLTTLTTNGTSGNPTALAAASDGRLFALFGVSGQVAIWNAPPSGNPNPVVPLGSNLASLIFSSDATRVFSADANQHLIRAIDAGAVPPVKAADVPVNSSAAPSALALAHNSAGDSLLVGDAQHSKLYVVPIDQAGSVVMNVGLSGVPIALVASPGAKWIYVLEKSAALPAKWFVEAVNLQKLLLGKPSLGQQVEVGNNAQTLVLSESGQTLYVAFDDTHGGVAIVEVSDDDCAETLWKALEGCPSCEEANCVVLATIENFNLDDKLTDQTDPPADPVSDTQQQIARIDNRKGRRLLPSTQLLTEVVECLLEHGGTGGTGAQGPQGPAGPSGQRGEDGADGADGTDGKDGLSIDKATAKLVPCGQNVSAKITGVSPDRTLELEIPTCCDTGLTTICSISWKHANKLQRAELKERGLLIAFSAPVARRDLHPHSLRVFAQVREHNNCWCEIDCQFIPGNCDPTCDLGKFNPASDPFVNAVRILPSIRVVETASVMRVIVQGDFIPDKDGKGLDADHLPPWMGAPKYKTGDGIAGGSFESWFNITN